MKKIKIRTRHDEYNKVNYYRDFDVVDELPPIEKVADLKDIKFSGYIAVKESRKDCEQPNEEAHIATAYDLSYFNYDEYESRIEDEEDEATAIEEATETRFLAIIPEN